MLKVGDVVRLTAAAIAARPQPGDWNPLFGQLGHFKFEVVRIQADGLGRPGYAKCRLGYIADQVYADFPLNRPLDQFYFREHWLEEAAPKWEAGAKVRIIGNPDDWFGFVAEMHAFVGMETTIREAQDGGEHFTIDGDFGVWQWHKSCLQLIGAAEEEKAIMPVYKVGDKVRIVGGNGWEHWPERLNDRIGQEVEVAMVELAAYGAPYVRDADYNAYGFQCIEPVGPAFPAANPKDKHLKRFDVGDRIVLQHTDPWLAPTGEDYRRANGALAQRIGATGRIIKVIDPDRITGQYYQIDWDDRVEGKPYLYQPDFALEPEGYAQEKEELKVGDMVYIVAPQKHNGILNDRKRAVIAEKGPYPIVRIGHPQEPDWVRVQALDSMWWFNKAALSLNPNGRGGRVKKEAPPPPPPYDQAAELKEAITNAYKRFQAVTSDPECSYVTFHAGNRALILNENYTDVCHARLATTYRAKGAKCLAGLNYVGYKLKQLDKKYIPAYKRMLEWVITKSPASDAFIQEPFDDMLNKGMKIDISKHRNQVALSCVMTREVSEYWEKLPIFMLGVENDVSPAASYLLFTVFDIYAAGEYAFGFSGGHKILDPGLGAKDVFEFLAGKTKFSNDESYADNSGSYQITSEIGAYNYYDGNRGKGNAPKAGEKLLEVLGEALKEITKKNEAKRGFGRGVTYSEKDVIALGKWIDVQIKEVK